MIAVIEETLGVRYHRRERRLRLARLPACAPELNPVEAVWRYLEGLELASVVCKNLEHP